MDITVIIAKIKEIMKEYFPLKEDIPTKTSDLINDNNFITNSDSRLSDARTPISHTHGQITNDGKITSDAVTMPGNAYYVVIADVYGNIRKTSLVPGDYIRDGAAHSNIGSNAGDTQYTINGKINTALGKKENISNKITSISSSSTDTQYPSAKCVFNNFATKEEVIEKINYGNISTSQGMRGHITAFYLFDYLYYGIKIDLEIVYGGDVNYNQLYAHFDDIFTYDDGVIDTNSLTITKPNNVNVSLYSMGSDGYGITISHTGTVPSSGIAKVMIYKVVPLFYNF